MGVLRISVNSTICFGSCGHSRRFLDSVPFQCLGSHRHTGVTCNNLSLCVKPTTGYYECMWGSTINVPWEHGLRPGSVWCYNAYNIAVIAFATSDHVGMVWCYKIPVLPPMCSLQKDQSMR